MYCQRHAVCVAKIRPSFFRFSIVSKSCAVVWVGMGVNVKWIRESGRELRCVCVRYISSTRLGQSGRIGYTKKEGEGGGETVHQSKKKRRRSSFLQRDM